MACVGFKYAQVFVAKKWVYRNDFTWPQMFSEGFEFLINVNDIAREELQLGLRNARFVDLEAENANLAAWVGGSVWVPSSRPRCAEGGKERAAVFVVLLGRVFWEARKLRHQSRTAIICSLHTCY